MCWASAAKRTRNQRNLFSDLEFPEKMIHITISFMWSFYSLKYDVISHPNSNNVYRLLSQKKKNKNSNKWGHTLGHSRNEGIGLECSVSVSHIVKQKDWSVNGLLEYVFQRHFQPQVTAEKKLIGCFHRDRKLGLQPKITRLNSSNTGSVGVGFKKICM